MDKFQNAKQAIKAANAENVISADYLVFLSESVWSEVIEAAKEVV